MPCLLQGSRGSDSSLLPSPCYKAIPALPDKFVLRCVGVCLNCSTRIGRRTFIQLRVPLVLLVFKCYKILNPGQNPFLKSLLGIQQGYVGLQLDYWDVCWVQDFGSFQNGPLPLTPLYSSIGGTPRNETLPFDLEANTAGNFVLGSVSGMLRSGGCQHGLG